MSPRRHLAAVAIAGLLILATMPTEVTHTRCLESEAVDQTGFIYRFVTRDDLATAAAGTRRLCVRARFRREFGIEELIDE